MGRLRLRQYSENDKHPIVRLLQEGHTKDYTPERWQWLHHTSATLGSHIVVAESDGAIVGACGIIKKRFTYNGEVLAGGKAVDPIVDKSMRGKGIFKKLLLQLDEMSNDLSFIYVFPNPISLHGYLKSGYTSIGPIPTPYCQLRFIGVPTKEKLRYLATGIKTTLRKKTNVVKGRLEDLKDLTPVAPKDRYALLRDWNYLKWRYGDSPIKSYDVLTCSVNGSIQSACVLHRTGWRLSIADIVEYTTETNLIDFLVAIKIIYGKSRILTWDSNVYGISRFFVGNKRKGQNFLVRQKKSNLPRSLLDKGHWYVTRGDVESN